MSRPTTQSPRKPKVLAAAVALGIALPAHAATYAPWLTQMGVSDTVLSAANWGKGQILGVVDTGIVAGNSVFAAGQVSISRSSCAAVTFRCANGVADDNGHGTAVAAIAAANGRMPFAVNYGGYLTPAGSVIGVAPNANIVAEKVLSAAGSGYSTDVANGLIKAANAGASVINLSLTFGNTPDLVAAINYAASKGAFIVWAGGNSATKLLGGASTSGLSAAAVSRLVLAGSVGAKNTLSSFSNTPGTGALVDTSGKKTTYATRWLMAPGENILAPYALYGNGVYSAWSGTSMSAPLVSGALMLLQSAWPILRTNGTTANLLLATATDLGTKGADASYGSGLVNLGTAFKPYGSLTVTQANGKPIAVTSLTGSMISSGALGGLAQVQSKLASYTSLDGYQRNFTVNLSALIKSPTGVATVNPLPTNTNTGPAKMALRGGGEIAFLAPAAPDRMAALGVFGSSGDGSGPMPAGYAMLTDGNGTSVAFGHGNAVPAQYSYTKALFGSDDAGLAAGDLSNHLSSLSQGGALMSYGARIGSDTRVAVSYSGTAAAGANPLSQGNSWAAPNAGSFTAGLTHRLGAGVQVGVSFQTLNERHGLLGSTYDAASALSLGSGNRSSEFGLSALVNLDADNSLFLEASQAATLASKPADGSFFAGTTAVRAQSYGISYIGRNLLGKADRLMLSLKQPLRVSAGAVNMAVTVIDADTGVPSLGVESVSLVPSGRERDFKIAYDTPIARNQKLGIQLGYVRDGLNMAGNNSSFAGMNWSAAF